MGVQSEIGIGKTQVLLESFKPPLEPGLKVLGHVALTDAIQQESRFSVLYKNCLGNSGLEQGEYRKTVIHAIHNLCCPIIKVSFKQVGQTCPYQSQKVKFGNTNVSCIAMCQKQVLCYFGCFVFIQL